MNLRLAFDGNCKRLAAVALVLMLSSGAVRAQKTLRPAPAKRPPPEIELPFPPQLPGGRAVVTDTSERFLQPPPTLLPGVEIARTPPRVDFLFYPGQDYPGQPWSNWGDGLAVDGKYYSTIGDHLAIGAKGSGAHGTGTALVFEYDPATRTFRKLVDVARLLDLPAGHYTPGKIHTRIDLGHDGWLYYATHRGSPRATSPEYHYRGDWILRTHPGTGASEILAAGPVPEHAIPTGILDPERLIFYGSTAPGVGREAEGIQFFAYDVQNRRLLYSGPNGPSRALILARSTGRVYYVPGNDEGRLMRFDPQTAKPPAPVEGSLLGVRSATEETADGFVYTVSLGQRSEDAAVWSFHTRTEETRKIGTAAVGTQAYIASLDVDPSGRWLYYVPGAHGGSEGDGSPVVQFDLRTGRKKVIAFLEPFYTETYDLTLKGTFSTAVDPAGDKLYITWNVSRGSRAWDCCGLTVVHLPASER